MKFEALSPVMDERLTRLWAAAEAEAYGRGGPAAVTKATGILGKRILAGRRDLAALRASPPTEPAQEQRIRKPGAGRKRLEDTQPGLVEALDALIDPSTRGDPESPLRWTCKSTRRLAEELTTQGFQISPTKVGELLAADGYSLQGNSKTREGSQHPDRNAQFERINRQVKTFQGKGQPVVSVDTKKKELVGDFKNVGREWQRRGEPVPVRGPRLPGPGTRQGDPVWRVRPAPKRGMGQRGGRPRHVGVRSRVAPSLVEADGEEGLPGGHGPARHG